jgi:hypothetical protein
MFKSFMLVNRVRYCCVSEQKTMTSVMLVKRVDLG